MVTQPLMPSQPNLSILEIPFHQEPINQLQLIQFKELQLVMLKEPIHNQNQVAHTPQESLLSETVPPTLSPPLQNTLETLFQLNQLHQLQTSLAQVKLDSSKNNKLLLKNLSVIVILNLMMNKRMSLLTQRISYKLNYKRLESIEVELDSFEIAMFYII